MKLIAGLLGFVSFLGCAGAPGGTWMDPVDPIEPFGPIDRGDPIARDPDAPATSGVPSPPLGEDGPRGPYPLILAHGLSGFENIGPINYFYGVAAMLRKEGHEVFAPAVDAFNSSDVRGAQLLAHVEDVLARTGARKVKLICHSQGGLDCRYVASVAGSKVAAIVTLSTPHHGTPLADIATGVLPGPTKRALEAMLNVLGVVLSGHPDMNAEAALYTLSRAGAEDFGMRHPDDPNVHYYSIAGRSILARGGDACATASEPSFVSRWSGDRDPLDPLLAIAAGILGSDVIPAPWNDGLVPVESARYGTFLGCIPADHLDEVCQLTGGPSGFGNPFDCHGFYRQLAEWMVARGY